MENIELLVSVNFTKAYDKDLIFAMRKVKEILCSVSNNDFKVTFKTKEINSLQRDNLYCRLIKGENDIFFTF